MQFMEFVVDRLSTHQGILVLRLLTLYSFLADPQDHRFDPFRIDPTHLLRCSRMILQAQRWFIGMVATDPALYPRTRSLQLPGDLTLRPALQMQSNGSFAQLDLGLHIYTSWFLLRKVYHMSLQFLSLELYRMSLHFFCYRCLCSSQFALAASGRDVDK